MKTRRWQTSHIIVYGRASCDRCRRNFEVGERYRVDRYYKKRGGLPPERGYRLYHYDVCPPRQAEPRAGHGAIF